LHEVKNEKFGSRPSVLEPMFKRCGITFQKGLYFVTCTRRFNCDVNTRYLIFLESLSEEDFESRDLSVIKACVKEVFWRRSYRVLIDEKDQSVRIRGFVSDQTMTFNQEDFKQFILKETQCGYEESSGRVGESSSPFSKFFRKCMGAAFAMTDIDFVLPGSILVEEKTFLRRANNDVYGYIGVGQCLSFNELLTDVLTEKCRIFLVFCEKGPQGKSFRLRPYSRMRCSDFKEYDDTWGQVVRIELSNECLYDESGLICFFRTESSSSQ